MMLRHVLGLVEILLLAGLGSAQGLYLGPDGPRPPEVARPPEVVRPVVPRPGMAQVRATQLRVTATVTDGVASTEVRQVFRNDGGRVREGTWILPLPPGATADGFTITVNGKEMAGEVLGADKARGIYEGIVRRLRDPGLLEYFGCGCLRARVFPIPAHGEMTVLVRFRQVLPEAGGLYEWRFPLRAAGANGAAPEKVVLDVAIRSRTELKNVYSPLGGVDVQRKGDHEARVSMETCGGQLPERDLSVFYGLDDGEFGLHLLAYRKGKAAGYFAMMLSPKRDWPVPANTRRAITFVLDTSGSMQGKKIEQARAALRFFVKSLRKGDLFNVVPFSTEARPFFSGPVEVSDANLAAAFQKIAAIEARGGTNIEDALRAAMKPEVPSAAGMTTIPIVVFLTDGLPTVGTTDVGQLLAQARQQNGSRARLFVFGVGNDVNTGLLDKLAGQSRGERDYVRENEDIEVKTGALFTKLSHPVMTQVELLCDGIEGFDLFPRQTPDLFKGSRLLVVGRYKGSGHHAIRLRGEVDGREKEYVFEGTFPDQATEYDFVPVLWAQRKVAQLLDAIRLNGAKKELLDEVKRLGVEFGIVTPYTSHLIVEEGMRVSRLRGVSPGGGGVNAWYGVDGEAGRRVARDLYRAGAVTPELAKAAERVRDLLGRASGEADRARDEMLRLPREKEGKKAVDDSVLLGAMNRSITLTSRGYLGGGGGAAGNVGNLVSRRIGDRTFYLAGGVWVDSRFSARDRGAARKVAAFSDDYFALLRAHPDLAPVLAFSTRIVIVLEGEVVEIV